jgi:hypothetical protein
MKFTVRDLLWLIMLVAANLNWYLYNQIPIEIVLHQEKIIDRISAENYVRKVRHDWLWKEGIFLNMSDAEWQSYPLPSIPSTGE